MARIETLKRAHRGEWLAIEVLREGTSGPKEGRLLHHSKTREDVWKRIRRAKGRVYVTYAGPLLEKGTAAAFAHEA